MVFCSYTKTLSVSLRGTRLNRKAMKVKFWRDFTNQKVISLPQWCVMICLKVLSWRSARKDQKQSRTVEVPVCSQQEWFQCRCYTLSSEQEENPTCKDKVQSWVLSFSRKFLLFSCFYFGSTFQRTAKFLAQCPLMVALMSQNQGSVTWCAKKKKPDHSTEMKYCLLQSCTAYQKEKWQPLYTKSYLCSGQS